MESVAALTGAAVEAALLSVAEVVAAAMALAAVAAVAAAAAALHGAWRWWWRRGGGGGGETTHTSRKRTVDGNDWPRSERCGPPRESSEARNRLLREEIALLAPTQPHSSSGSCETFNNSSSVLSTNIKTTESYVKNRDESADVLSRRDSHERSPTTTLSSPPGDQWSGEIQPQEPLIFYSATATVTSVILSNDAPQPLDGCSLNGSFNESFMTTESPTTSAIFTANGGSDSLVTGNSTEPSDRQSNEAPVVLPVSASNCDIDSYSFSSSLSSNVSSFSEVVPALESSSVAATNEPIPHASTEGVASDSPEEEPPLVFLNGLSFLVPNAPSESEPATEHLPPLDAPPITWVATVTSSTVVSSNITQNGILTQEPEMPEIPLTNGNHSGQSGSTNAPTVAVPQASADPQQMEAEVAPYVDEEVTSARDANPLLTNVDAASAEAHVLKSFAPLNAPYNPAPNLTPYAFPSDPKSKTSQKKKGKFTDDDKQKRADITLRTSLSPGAVGSTQNSTFPQPISQPLRQDEAAQHRETEKHTGSPGSEKTKRSRNRRGQKNKPKSEHSISEPRAKLQEQVNTKTEAKSGEAKVSGKREVKNTPKAINSKSKIKKDKQEDINVDPNVRKGASEMEKSEQEVKCGETEVKDDALEVLSGFPKIDDEQLDGAEEGLDPKGPLRLQRCERLGRYLCASRALGAGERVLLEGAALVGPRADAACASCLRCLRALPRPAPLCDHCVAAPLCSGCKHRDAPFGPIECSWLSGRRGPPPDLCRPRVVLVVRALMMRRSGDHLWARIERLESHMEQRRGGEAWQDTCTHVYQPLKASGLLESDEDEELIQRISGILDVNTFEVRAPGAAAGAEPGAEAGAARALFPGAALLAHDCLPSAHVAVDEQHVAHVRTARALQEGEPITLCYAAPLHATAERREHLLHGKYFECGCKRCRDPEECGTRLGGVRCPRCRKGDLLPPASGHGWWACRSAGAEAGGCGHRAPPQLAATTHARARDLVEAAVADGDERQMEALLATLRRSLPSAAAPVLQLIQALIASYRSRLQSAPRPPVSLLSRQVALARELIEAADILAPGDPRLAAVARYELHGALATLAQRRHAGSDGGCGAAELVEGLREAERQLNAAASALLTEPPASPEGRLGRAAVAQLRELREDLLHAEALAAEAPRRRQQRRSEQRTTTPSRQTTDAATPSTDTIAPAGAKRKHRRGRGRKRTVETVP